MGTHLHEHLHRRVRGHGSACMRTGIHLSHPAYPHEIDYNFGWMDGCSVLEQSAYRYSFP